MDSVNDLSTAIAHVHAPEPRQAIQQPPTRRIGQVAAIGGHDHLSALSVHLEMIGEGVQMKRSVRLLQFSERHFVHAGIENTMRRGCQACAHF